MKRQLLVLDAFTNGHEAALRFIRKKGWKRTDYEIVFCGSQKALLNRLCEGPSFAVVPVFNSIAGEVTEVTETLADLRNFGYVLNEISNLQLRINHCLLGPQHIIRAQELERVLSHEKAIQQCGKFLDSIGIKPDKRGKQDSTGNAAKRVSLMGPHLKIGAIAPKAAAKAYGLKILAEKIQDSEKNETKFILLENRAYIAPLTVGIFGIAGKFGKVLSNFFKSLGCEVIGTDPSLKETHSKEFVAVNSSVLIFATPIDQTDRVIQEIAHLIRPHQLLMDITSVKQDAVNAMLNTQGQVVGLHPMFAPEIPFEGQTIVACPARLITPHWKTWVVNVLAATKAQIKWSNPKEHDAYMATVQVSPHLANLVNAVLIKEMGISTEESLAFTSPFYRIMFSLMGRLLSQDAGLYSSIAMRNQATVPMLRKRIAIEKKLLRIMEQKDQEAFLKLFQETKEYFGNDIARDANELFLRMNSLMKTLYGQNTVILEFNGKDSQPGFLERIARVFHKHGVNLTGINSVVLGGNLQFTLSFEQSRLSDQVRWALEEIEKWQTPKVTIKN